MSPCDSSAPFAYQKEVRWYQHTKTRKCPPNIIYSLLHFPPAPKAVYNWQIYALPLSAAMGSAMFGYDSAFIGGAITLQSVSGNELAALKANIVSTFQADCFFGAILCYPVTEKLGRRIPLILCGLIFNLGAILQVASNGIIGMVYGGRALTGEFQLEPWYYC
jgi:hypothetical protein